MLQRPLVADLDSLGFPDRDIVYEAGEIYFRELDGALWRIPSSGGEAERIAQARRRIDATPSKRRTPRRRAWRTPPSLPCRPCRGWRRRCRGGRRRR